MDVRGTALDRNLANEFNLMADQLGAMTTKASEALAEVHRLLERERMFTEALGLGQWRYDLRDQSVQIDERFALMLGETVATYGHDAAYFNARVHPDDRDRVWVQLAGYLEEGLSRFESEFRMRHHDGSWRWISSFGAVVERDEEGRPVVLAGTHRDVTEIHRAREELAAQQRFITTLSSNVPGVLHRLRVDNDGTLSLGFVGRNAKDMFGIDADEFTPQRLFELVTPETREATAAKLTSELASGSHAEVEYELVLPDGRYRAVRCEANLVGRDAGGTDWDGIVFDITGEVEQRRELKRARAAAESANEAKTAFLAAMSHELRTPLTGILGYAQLIELRGRDPAVVPLAATIRKSAERMRELLNDVLDVAKIEAGAMAVEIAPMALGPLVCEVAELFRPAVDDKGLSLVVETGAAGEILVAGDAKRVRQVLVNLVSNAVKFTARGDITVSLRADDEAVHVRVADTGAGVSEDFRKAIFGRFRQADGEVARQHGGTGLGLALSRDFAHLMGGDVVLGDTNGPGAAFELRLPRQPDGASSGVDRTGMATPVADTPGDSTVHGRG